MLKKITAKKQIEKLKEGKIIKRKNGLS